MFPRGQLSDSRHCAALLVACVLVVALSAGCSSPDRLTTARVSLDGIELTVEVADTVRERARGLQGRPQPADDAGMLFVWKDSGLRSFAIEDVPFDLDVIFVGGDGLVTEVLPLSQSGPFRAEAAESVRWVLEVRGGWARAHRIGLGSEFSIIEQ